MIQRLVLSYHAIHPKSVIKSIKFVDLPLFSSARYDWHFFSDFSLICDRSYNLITSVPLTKLRKQNGTDESLKEMRRNWKVCFRNNHFKKALNIRQRLEQKSERNKPFALIRQWNKLPLISDGENSTLTLT